MKTILSLIMLAVAACEPVAAEILELSWDKNPEPDIVSYTVAVTRAGVTTPQVIPVADLREEVAGDKTRLVVSMDIQPLDSVTVSASDALFTSPPSDPLVLGAGPSTPGTLRVKHTVTLQQSNNLGEWQTLATVSTYDSAQSQKFYRVANP